MLGTEECSLLDCTYLRFQPEAACSSSESVQGAHRDFCPLSLSPHLNFYSCTSIRTQAGSVRGVEAAAIHPSPTKPGPHEIRGRDNKATTQEQPFHI